MPKSVRFIFWCHFLIALMAHILVPIMLIATIYEIVSWDRGFLMSGLLIGLTFCAFIWGANHINDPDSYCWLTDLEKHYRKINEVQDCQKDFLPRFYKKVRGILNGDFKTIPE